MCRKTNSSYSILPSPTPIPDLKAEGIIDILRFVEILGAKIEILQIFNAQKIDLQALIGHPQTESIILEWGQTRSDITYYETLLI